MASDVYPPNASHDLSYFVVERAFLVKESCLDILFQCLVCFRCHCSPQRIAKYVDGDCLFVTVFCPSGHRLLHWSSKNADICLRQYDASCKPKVPLTEITELVGDHETHREVSVAGSMMQGSEDETEGDGLIKEEAQQSQEQEGHEAAILVIKVEQEEDTEPRSESGLRSGIQVPLQNDAAPQMTVDPQVLSGPILYDSGDLVPPGKSHLTSSCTVEPNEATVAARSTVRAVCDDGTSPKSQDKKHACSFCKKQFSMDYSVKLHEWMHRRNHQRLHSYFSCAKMKVPVCRRKNYNPWRRIRNYYFSQVKHCWFLKSTQRKNPSADLSYSEASNIPSNCCQICSKMLPTPFRKWVHDCSHYKLKPHRCQLCPREFVSKSLLRMHLQIHIIEKQFACNICCKQFVSASNCQQHKNTHPDCRPYQCSFCELSFETHMDRKVHQKSSHSGKKTVTCQFCHKIFSNMKDCRSHERKHILLCASREDGDTSANEEDSPILRNILEKMDIEGESSANGTVSITSKSSSAEEHIPVATSCKFCGKEFLSSSRLIVHEYVHRHMMLYKCQYCPKSFVTASTLKWHVGIDHRVQCDICCKKFPDLCVCEEHEQDHRLSDQCMKQKINSIKPLDVGLSLNVDMLLEEENRFSNPRDANKRIKPEKEQNQICSGIPQSDHPPDALLNMKPSISNDTYTMQSPVRAVPEVIGAQVNDKAESSHERTSHPSSLKRTVLLEPDEHSPVKEIANEGSGSFEDVIMLPSPAKTITSSLCCRYCGKQLSSNTSRKYHERIHTGEKPHKCSYCPKAFSDGSILKAHERIHTGEKPYPCSYCDKKFFQSAHRSSHERVHTREKPYPCSFCDARFATSSWRHKHEERVHSSEKRYNLKQEGGENSNPSGGGGTELSLQTNRPVRKPYPCHFCDKVMYAEGNRKVHERKHMGEWSTKCNFCVRIFPSAELLKVHEVTHLGEKPFRCRYCDECFDSSLTRTSHEYIHTKDMAFTCNRCDVKFASKSASMDHEQLHCSKPYKCKYCDQSFSFSTALRDHEVTCGSLKTHGCKYCGKQFATLKYHRAHVATHASDRPFTCTMCGKAFRTRTDVKKHELIHAEGTPFNCRFCNKAFHTTVGVKKHELTHSAARAFKCRYCEKGFKTKASSEVHERCHTGEKPYPCAYCGIRFSSITARKTHNLLHTGEVPYKCQYCDRPFRHASSLTRHVRIHTGEMPYKCRHCGELFRDIKPCKNHEMKHTGEKPYMCSYCGKAFRNNMHLVKHERIHTGEKPYKCLYCEEWFSFYSGRKNHMRRFHGEMVAKDKVMVSMNENNVAAADLQT